jgi:predicted dehydrogenase
MYKVAVIGAGNIARTVHLPTYDHHKDCQLVAISDVNEKLLKETADQFKIEKIYTDYREMITNEKPDIVSICTPNKFHKEQSIFALRNGAHVVCEKPPALSLVELAEMRNYAIENHHFLVFNFHHRLREEAQLMKAWYQRQTKESFYFGEIVALRRKGVPGWGSFTNHELSGGGPLIDIGIHMLDLALFILDDKKVKYVSASWSNRIGIEGGVGDFGSWIGTQFGVEDSLFGQIMFEDHTSLHLQTAFTHHMLEKSKMNVKLYSTQESIELSPFQRLCFHQVLENKTGEVFKTRSIIDLLLDALNGHHVNLIDVNSVWQTQAVVDALYESAKTNSPVFIR